MLECSLSRDSELDVRFLLFLGKCAEETDLLLAGWLPLVV